MKLLSCLSHKVCHRLSSPFLLYKFTNTSIIVIAIDVEHIKGFAARTNHQVFVMLFAILLKTIKPFLHPSTGFKKFLTSLIKKPHSFLSSVA